MQEEVWKSVVGYEGLYEVSSFGRVRSLDRIVAHHSAGTALRKGKIRKLAFDGNYFNVSLTKDKKTKVKRVHRLVAEAFIPNPSNYSDVDHIDCNKLNNRVDNLRWCTSAENTRFAWEQGLITKPPVFSELDDKQKSRALMNHIKPIVRSDGKHYESTAAAARDLGVTPGAVSHVLSGLTQTCKGYSFAYV